MAAEDKHWASKYLLDPLNEPDPSDETGIVGMSAANRSNSGKKSSTKRTPAASTTEINPRESSNPFRRNSASIKSDSSRQPRHPNSDSSGTLHDSTNPLASHGGPSHRGQALHSDKFGVQTGQRRSMDLPTNDATQNRGHRRRSSSLKERYPGDTSVQPLETLKREEKLANRSPHLRKRHIQGPDTIDQLDMAGAVGSRYHHEGPYDAASLARNNSYESSPIHALDRSNNEALKATPSEKIHDSVQRHRPLDGTAQYPPGESDPLGTKYRYEEGDNMMIVDGGNYKRWPGVTYHPDDIKGKGEPSFSMDRVLKEHGADETDGVQAMELDEHPRQRDAQSYAEWERDSRRSSGHRLSGELKRRFGSLKKSKHGA